MIDKEMSIKDIVEKYPQTVSLFQQYGLGCAGCQAALFENLEQGARVHGVSVDALIKDLKMLISEGRQVAGPLVDR
jgi:hybrid cluster-associated redox disulfide protein